MREKWWGGGRDRKKGDKRMILEDGKEMKPSVYHSWMTRLFIAARIEELTRRRRDREWFGSKNNTCVSVSSGQFIQSVWGVRERKRGRNKREEEEIYCELRVSKSVFHSWNETTFEKKTYLKVLSIFLPLSVCLPLNLSPSSESKFFSLTVKRPCFERNQKV